MAETAEFKVYLPPYKPTGKRLGDPLDPDSVPGVVILPHPIAIDTEIWVRIENPEKPAIFAVFKVTGVKIGYPKETRDGVTAEGVWQV